MTVAGPRLRVLCSFREPRPTTNPYITMLLRELRTTPELIVAPFSFTAALTRRWDVFHSHWPEVALSASSPARRWIRRALFALMLLSFAVRRTAVVQTVHNLRPHEDQDPAARWLLARLAAMTTTRIALNHHTAAASGLDCVEIPHGHYVDWFASHPHHDPEPGTVVFAGLVRRYKNVDGLVRTFGQLDDPDLRLRVTGRCEDEHLADDLRRAAAADPRITSDLRFLTDAELSAVVTGGSVVALPYHDLHNSGAALLALSLGRPILVPGNDVTEALAAEVGDDWVYRFEGSLRPAALARAARTPVPQGSPDLRRRAWDAVGRAHGKAYRAAVADRRRRRRT